MKKLILFFIIVFNVCQAQTVLPVLLQKNIRVGSSPVSGGGGEGGGSYYPVTIPAAANPTGVTWTNVSQKYYQPSALEYFHLIDKNHFYYTSNFSAGLSNLSALTGTTPTLSGGNLQVTGSTTLITSTTSPATPWNSTELLTDAMGAGGQAGPMLIKNANNYLAAPYDKTANQFKVIQTVGGTTSTLFTKTPSVSEWGGVTSNLKILLNFHGNNLSVWIRENNLLIKFVGSVVLTDIDLTADGEISNWKYGIYCNSSGSTHSIASLRGGASGGAGFFNNHFTEYASGKPYMHSGDRLFTADWTSFGTQAINYIYATPVLFKENTTTHSVESFTRFYIRRDDGDGLKIVGGQAIKLKKLADGTWLFSYVPLQSDGSLLQPDRYTFLTDEQVLGGGEVIIDDSDMLDFGFYDSPANIYDLNAYLIDGTWYVEGALGFGSPRPVVYYGPSLDNLSAKYTYDDGTVFESGQLCWFGNTPYWLFSTFGNSRVRVFTLNLTSLGWLQLPEGSGSRIGGWGFSYDQSGGNTFYNCSGFRTTEIAPTDITGTTQSMPWTMDEKTDYRSVQHSVGYEFEP
jgi:hypothetical protein